MTKAEHAAICPIDHRLDHLSHSPSTDFSLSEVLGKKKRIKIQEIKKPEALTILRKIIIYTGKVH